MEVAGCASMDGTSRPWRCPLPQTSFSWTLRWKPPLQASGPQAHILEKRPKLKVIFLTAHETDNIILTSMGAGR